MVKFNTMNTETKTQVYAAVVTILLLTALTGTAILYDGRGNLMERLKKEKLNSEKLLSEKLLLDKEIANLKGELNVVIGQNKDLISKLEMASNEVSEGSSQFKLMK